MFENLAGTVPFQPVISAEAKRRVKKYRFHAPKIQSLTNFNVQGLFVNQTFGFCLNLVLPGTTQDILFRKVGRSATRDLGSAASALL